MIELRKGDLFSSGADALVNPVNCVGVSGKGLAKEFAKRFKAGDRMYRNACMSGELTIGSVVVWRGSPSIIYVPTKDHWRHPSTITYVSRGLWALRAELMTMKNFGPSFGSVAVPALGCGNGGLSWADVRPLTEKVLADLDMQVFLYEPV